MSWRTVQLAEFTESGGLDIQTGPFGTQLRASDYTSEGTPVINVRNIGYGDLRQEKLEYVPEQVVSRLAKHQLEIADIVFGRKGAVDRHLLVSESEAGWMQGSDCIRLRILTDEINPQFLSFALRLPSHRQWMIAQCSNKATMASLNQDVMGRIRITLPERAIQDRIASLLKKYDDLIANNRRRIKLLEQAMLLLYNEWFVRLRFPGYEHVTTTAGVPDGWELVSVGDVLTLQRGFDLPVHLRKDGNVPIYASTGINGFHVEAKVSGPGVVTGRSGSLGKVMYVAGDFWPLNTTLWVKEFKRVGPHFATHLLARLHLEQYNGGAAVPTLNRNDVHRIKVVCPPQQLLKQFEDQANILTRQIVTLTRMNGKVEQARDLLLPRLMRGEIQV